MKTAAARRGQFGRHNQPVKCGVCGKLTTDNASGSVGGILRRGSSEAGICGPCFDASGLENAHLDGHHADEPRDNCPMCKAERS